MAKEHSFDVVSDVDFQEVENALGQARKEIGTRYDFKGVHVEIVRDKEKITITADDEFRLRAAIEVLTSKFIKRAVPVKNIEYSKQEAALGGSVRQIMNVRSGISSEISKDIVKTLKDQKRWKIQASIQGDQVRVTAKSKDTLQKAIGLLKEEDFGLELQFSNFR
ncbi:MAG: YajQ family cyclic di-GMP-binding protein [Candidatus Lindowbacteria bacterium]|nr:YajQ family cyclic di-GMP-binding protein [Candidatus Lindowbacteria bacterium]